MVTLAVPSLSLPTLPVPAGGPLDKVRTGLRWGLEQGLPKVYVKRAAGHGDPQAQLIVDPAVRADPYPTLDRVRERGDLVRGQISFVTATHAVAKEMLRSDDFAVGLDPESLPGPLASVGRWARDVRVLGPLDPPSLLAVEPPDHTRYRNLVSKVFTARAVERLRSRVEAVAESLLDELGDDLVRQSPGDTVDLVDRYAMLLPVTVIAEILGVPASERERVLRFGNAAAPSLDLGLSFPEYVRVQNSLREFNAWLDGLLNERRRAPGDDLLSQLVTVSDAKGGLTDEELRATAGLVLAAGFETTVNLLGNGIKLLTDNPEQLQVLRDEPALWANTVDEVLRLESPVQVTARHCVRDTVLAGHQVEAGQFVVALLAGANRDPAVFAEPGSFDVRRDNAREHLSFSGGRHFCLGAALARQEGEVGLRMLFDRFPDLTLAPGARRRRTRVLRGWATLPAQLTPATVAV